METLCRQARRTGKSYSLLNQMLLGRSGEWITFSQCQQEGGHVRKGEKASMVVFWKWLDRKDEETGEITQVPYLRYYNVFHIDQCEGITAKHTTENVHPAKPDEAADAIIVEYHSAKQNVGNIGRTVTEINESEVFQL